MRKAVSIASLISLFLLSGCDVPFLMNTTPQEGISFGLIERQRTEITLQMSQGLVGYRHKENYNNPTIKIYFDKKLVDEAKLTDWDIGNEWERATAPHGRPYKRNFSYNGKNYSIILPPESLLVFKFYQDTTFIAEIRPSSKPK
jgi:hypothetical protein